MPRRLGGRQARKGKKGTQSTGAGQAQPRALALAGARGRRPWGVFSALAQGPSPCCLLLRHEINKVGRLQLIRQVYGLRTDHQETTRTSVPRRGRGPA